MIFLRENVIANISSIPRDILKTVISELTIDNPMLEKRAQLGLTIFGIPAKVRLYSMEGDRFYAPIGYAERLIELLNVKKEDIVDLRCEGKSIDIEFTGKLRPYQEQAVNILYKHTIGVVSAPTGSGKTIMMCDLIAKRKVTTLVLVNTIELANQFRENLLKFTNLKPEEIHIIASGSGFKVTPVTIALLQSAYKFSEQKMKLLNDYIGQTITDEVHIVGADTYFSVLNNLKTKYKYGFSATPERDDGLTKLIFLASGNIRKDIKISELGKQIMLPTIKAIPTNYHFPFFDMNEYQTMITDLSKDKDRNQLIAATLSTSEYKDKQKVLLCARVMQCVLLQQLIPGSKILVGGISKEDQEEILKTFPDSYEEIVAQRGKKYRKSIVEELNSGKLKTVISTFGLFSTGLDFQQLEVAAFCAPMKSKILVKQCRGRIMRVDKNKSPVCVDFEDGNVSLLKQQSKTRQRILKRFD